MEEAGDYTKTQCLWTLTLAILAWTNTPRKSGGLGEIHIPLLADLTKQVSRDYGVLLEGPGIALRGLFIIDPNGVIRHMSVNDLPVGRSV
ncbi:thioredoxin-dependent peroxide reductase, mitochondrial-like [Carassius carassius]|uniref:thioredoxin-dependent peroxide reductase, mitochondrial-like n=1 Tax=Carassius carassius TaxID=217509 RepID=UPI00286912D6|nr:thioredoxin-dependent peroxide reductase, mitochondrial-like [Carassius carassius]